MILVSKEVGSNVSKLPILEALDLIHMDFAIISIRFINKMIIPPPPNMDSFLLELSLLNPPKVVFSTEESRKFFGKECLLFFIWDRAIIANYKFTYLFATNNSHSSVKTSVFPFLLVI